MGQAAIVTADAYPGRKFGDQVVEISHAMEAKSVLSDDPSQKTDRDVLDVIIQMKPSKQDLPIGLRAAEMTGEVKPLAQSSPAPSSSNHSAGQKVPGAPAEQKATLAASEIATMASRFLLQAGVMTHTENADALADICGAQGMLATARKF